MACDLVVGRRFVNWPHWRRGAFVGVAQLLDILFGRGEPCHQHPQHIVEFSQQLILKG